MIPTFHDGLLTGINVSKSDATLFITRVDDTRWRLDLVGVSQLRADDFRQGNIISHLEVISGTAPPREWLAELIGPPHPSAAREYHDKHRDSLDRMSRSVENGEVSLLVVTPSYGCDLLALCTGVRATPG